MDSGPTMWPWTLTSPIALTLDIEAEFLNICIIGMGGPINIGRKAWESIECWAYFVTSNFDLTHDLDIEFLDIHVKIPMTLTLNFWIFRLKFKRLHFRNGWSAWFETKDIWIDTHDLQLGFSRWNFENNCIPKITPDVTLQKNCILHFVTWGNGRHSGVTLEMWAFLPWHSSLFYETWNYICILHHFSKLRWWR